MPTSLPNSPVPSLADFGCDRAKASKSLIRLGLGALLLVGISFGFAAAFDTRLMPENPTLFGAASTPLLAP